MCFVPKCILLQTQYCAQSRITAFVMHVQERKQSCKLKRDSDLIVLRNADQVCRSNIVCFEPSGQCRAQFSEVQLKKFLETKSIKKYQTLLMDLVTVL